MLALTGKEALDPVTVFAVVNQKGGVGKTTTVINLGAYLGAQGRRVLLVDCDMQSNTTQGIGAGNAGAGLYDVLIEDVPTAHAVVRTRTPEVELLPATGELAGIDLALHGLDHPQGRLREVLLDIRDAYDYIFLDCPPSLGMMTVNALVAADAVLVPVQCEYLALEGLARLMDTLERVRAGWNPGLRVFGLVMTMYDGRTSLSQQVEQEVRRHYPTLTFETIIPRSIRLGEAPSYGQSILDYDPVSRGAKAYHALALEVAARAPLFGG